MDNIWKVSKLASQFFSIAEGTRVRRFLEKNEIVQSLEKAYDLIDEDTANIKKNEQKLRAEKVDPTFPAEAKYQLDQNLQRYLVLSDFLLRDFERWLFNTLNKMKRLSSTDISDYGFLEALKKEMSKLEQVISQAKQQLAADGLRLDLGELFSLAMVRRVVAHQIDAFDQTPTDPASILMSGKAINLK